MKIAKSAACIGSLFDRMPGVQGLAAGGLLALAAWSPAAYAVPVLSSASNLVVPATAQGLYVNVVTGVSNVAPAAVPGWDINPFSSLGLSFFNPTAPAGGVYVSSVNSPVGNLAVGSSISAGSVYSSGTATFGALANQWALNSTNYFGFRFTGEDTLVHYGYGTMVVGSSNLIRSIGVLYYESVAGTAITVSAVPEPSTSALWLAGGALGAFALRRRRQAGR